MRSGLRIHRRLNVCSQSSTDVHPTLAGWRFFTAAIIASEIFPGSMAAYSGSIRLPRQPIADGAECVCVALTSILSAGMPVASDACFFAASMRSRAIMQVSTTQKTIFTFPSSIASARAVNGSTTLPPERSVNMAFTRTGNFPGLISTMLAPARNGGPSEEAVSAMATPSRVSGRIRNRRGFLMENVILATRPPPGNGFL